MPTLCGAVLVIVVAAAACVWWRGIAAAARRWLADPPGPPREPLPLTWIERWTTGRRLAWLTGTTVVLLVAVVLLAELLS